MIKQIKDGVDLIAIIGSIEDAAYGNHFITENELPMQIGILRTDKGDGGIKKHIHKVRNRQQKSISNEFHIVLRGKVIVTFYNNDKKQICKITLCPNMFYCLYSGGHGFEFIKDDTILVEVKAGVFEGVELDKEKF